MPREFARVCNRLAHYKGTDAHGATRRTTVPVPDDMTVRRSIMTADGVTLHLINLWNDRDDADAASVEHITERAA